MIDVDKLLTNNSMACTRFEGIFDVDYRDLIALDLLKVVRDMVHQGHKLHTHPVTSGTAPNGSPFISVVLSKETSATDFESVSVIEAAIGVYTKMGKRVLSVQQLPEAIAKDFMLINCEMIAKDKMLVSKQLECQQKIQNI